MRYCLLRIIGTCLHFNSIILAFVSYIFCSFCYNINSKKNVRRATTTIKNINIQNKYRIVDQLSVIHYFTFEYNNNLLIKISF